MKIVLFARVSSKEQEMEGYSLPSQEKLLTDYAQRRNFDIGKVFSISESAAGRKQRKTFIEMLNYVIKNKINIIICEKVDRATRNLKDAVAINDWLEENPERQIHFVKQNLIIHKNSKSDEKFRWDIEVVLARKYITNLSEEVKKGQKEKLAQGWLPVKPPLGYKSTGTKGHITHFIDPEKGLLVKRTFELYSGGNYSLAALIKTMKQEGLRNCKNQPLVKSTIHKLLSNHFYYGKNEWNGELYNGKQEPLISKELFDLVQEKLSYKFGGKPRYRKHLPVFKAKIKCEGCGGVVTWECQKGHWYGHCNHYRDCPQQKWIKQTQVEDQMVKYYIKAMPNNKRILKWLEEALKRSHVNEIDYNTERREELNRIIKTADQRIEGAYRDKLDGRMPIALCEKLIKESNKEKEESIDSLAKLSESRAAYYKAGYSIHELAMQTAKIYNSEKATSKEKRLLLSYIFSNFSLNEGIIRVEYTPAFEFLIKWMPRLKSTFEPSKMPLFKTKTDDFSSVCPVVRGRGDLNP